MKKPFFEKCLRTSNPPDELAQNVSTKFPFGRIIPPLFFKSSDSDYLHDSNSIFRVGRINSEWVSARTVPCCWTAVKQRETNGPSHSQCDESVQNAEDKPWNLS